MIAKSKTRKEKKKKKNPENWPMIKMLICKFEEKKKKFIVL